MISLISSSMDSISASIPNSYLAVASSIVTIFDFNSDSTLSFAFFMISYNFISSGALEFAGDTPPGYVEFIPWICAVDVADEPIIVPEDASF